MLVRITRNLGREFPRHNEDDVVEVADDIARILLSRGLAIEMPDREIKAVPNESVAQAEKDLKEYKRRAKGSNE